VGEGFVEITGQRVAVMTDMAIKADDIDETKAEEARKRAEARLAEKLGDEESAMVSAALAHSLAQLKVKRRQRH
jgi:F-type H+-transporting ATPase subunit epsilon